MPFSRRGFLVLLRRGHSIRVSRRHFNTLPTGFPLGSTPCYFFRHQSHLTLKWRAFLGQLAQYSSPQNDEADGDLDKRGSNDGAIGEGQAHQAEATGPAEIEGHVKDETPRPSSDGSSDDAGSANVFYGPVFSPAYYRYKAWERNLPVELDFDTNTQLPDDDQPPTAQELLSDVVRFIWGNGLHHDLKRLADAVSRNAQDPKVMISQLLIYRNPEKVPAPLREALIGEAEWLVGAIPGKIPRDLDELQCLAWILEAPDAEQRIARFLSKDSPKPAFVLRLVLRVDVIFADRAQLSTLLQYAFMTHWRGVSAYARERKSQKAMQATEFMDLISRFVYHCRKVWPQLLPTVALLAQSYLANHHYGIKYREKVEVFNAMMQIFARPAFHRGAFHIEYNWRAQQVLLVASQQLGHPLTIERATYQAIRQVFLARKKTPEERDLASRYLDSWPPYIVSRDGMDEIKEPDEVYSVAVRIGCMMQSAGYEFGEGDVMLDILAGRRSDGTPTIRQRRLVSAEAVSRATRRNTWAARVAATRNAQEAWAEFKQRPSGMEGDKIPSIVYAEMFEKIGQESASEHTDVMPGDGPVQFDIPTKNLSAWGEEDSRPPSIKKLYQDMIENKVAPGSTCLKVLLDHARSLTEAKRYLSQACRVDRTAVMSMTTGIPTAEDLAKIDIAIVFAYVKVLCRLQPHRRHRVSVMRQHWTEPSRFPLLSRAFHIMMERVNLGSKSTWFRTFGTEILEALAGPEIMFYIDMSSTRDRQFALTKFMGLLTMMRRRVGIDIHMFRWFRCIVQNSLEHRICRVYGSVVHKKKIRSFFYSDLMGDTTKAELPADADADANADVFDSFTGEVPRNAAGNDALVMNSIRALKQTFRELIALPTQVVHSGDSAVESDILSTVARFSNVLSPVLSQKGAGEGLMWRPPAHEAAQAAQLHKYMRTLAFIGDWDEMLWLLGWMAGTLDPTEDMQAPTTGPELRFGAWDEADVLDLERGWGMMHRVHLSRALCAFRAFAEPALADRRAQVDDLVARVMGKRGPPGPNGSGGWIWPSDEDVESYIDCDSRGIGTKLRAVIQASRDPVEIAEGERLDPAVGVWSPEGDFADKFAEAVRSVGDEDVGDGDGEEDEVNMESFWEQLRWFDEDDMRRKKKKKKQ